MVRAWGVGERMRRWGERKRAHKQSQSMRLGELTHSGRTTRLTLVSPGLNALIHSNCPVTHFLLFWSSNGMRIRESTVDKVSTVSCTHRWPGVSARDEVRGK